MPVYKLADWDILRMSMHYRGDSHQQRDDDYLPFEDNYAYTGSVGFENEMALLNEKMSLVMGVSYDWFEVDEASSNETDDDGAFVQQVAASVPDKKR